MHVQAVSAAPNFVTSSNNELVALVLRGHNEAFRHLMQRSNQRLFRIARGVLNDDAEAEDVVQSSYLHAYEKLATFRGDANVLTWLTRIVLNEAYGRLRERKSTVAVELLDAGAKGEEKVMQFPAKYAGEDPASTVARAQTRHLLEQAVAALPEAFRLVFILRDIEECSTEEAAATLGIRVETVKTRLHRARRLLRVALHDSLRASLGDTFAFLGARCARMTDGVMKKLADLSMPAPSSDADD